MQSVESKSISIKQRWRRSDRYVTGRLLHTISSAGIDNLEKTRLTGRLHQTKAAEDEDPDRAKKSTIAPIHHSGKCKEIGIGIIPTSNVGGNDLSRDLAKRYAVTTEAHDREHSGETWNAAD